MTITRKIPPITNSNLAAYGQPLAYGNYIALANLFNGYLLLSGGDTVRTNVTTIGRDEQWEILSIDGTGGTIHYGDLVKIAMPKRGSILLSGGDRVRTNTTNVGAHETWQIQSLYAGQDQKEVHYGDVVIFTLPQYGDNLLSGGDWVRTNTTFVNTQEAWQIFKPS